MSRFGPRWRIWAAPSGWIWVRRVGGQAENEPSAIKQGISRSPDRRLDRDRAHRAGAGADAVRDLCHHLHDLPDDEGAKGVAARVERGVEVEDGIDADHIPLHQLRRGVVAAAGCVVHQRLQAVLAALDDRRDFDGVRIRSRRLRRVALQRRTGRRARFEGGLRHLVKSLDQRVALLSVVVERLLGRVVEALLVLQCLSQVGEAVQQGQRYIAAVCATLWMGRVMAGCASLYPPPPVGKRSREDDRCHSLCFSKLYGSRQAFS